MKKINCTRDKVWWIKRTSQILFCSYLLQLLVPTALLAVSVSDQLKEEKIETQVAEDPFGEKNSSTSSSEHKIKDEFDAKDTIIIPDRKPHKDPRLACLLSLVLPGGGDIYLKKSLKGISFCLATTTIYLMSFYFMYKGIVVGGVEGKSQVLAASIGLGVAMITHILSMVESYNDAVQINEAKYYGSE